MSDENYRNLSEQLTALREDMDARFEKVDRRLDVMDGKMLPARWIIASVLVPLGAVALAFIGACAVVIFGS